MARLFFPEKEMNRDMPSVVCTSRQDDHVIQSLASNLHHMTEPHRNHQQDDVVDILVWAAHNAW